MTLDDRLRQLRDAIQVDVGNRGLARDPVDNLFTACPDDFAAACRSIAHHPAPRVGVVTGFMIPSVDPPTGETDGPPGALCLAQALHQMGIPCVLLSDRSAYDALWAGLEFRNLVEGVSLIDLSMDLDPVAIWHAARPVTHLVAVERCGPNDRGRNLTMRGREVTDLTAPAHRLFEGPRDYVTIGVGDGSNEIGMGKLPRATIRTNIPNGDVIACRTATDYLIVAGTSNWGAYALAAGVMLMRGRPDPDLFDPDREKWILEDLVRRVPLIDGVTGQRTATVDGLTWAEYAKALERVRDVVQKSVEA
jgi:hypothetical protein